MSLELHVVMPPMVEEQRPLTAMHLFRLQEFLGLANRLLSEQGPIDDDGVNH